MKRKNITLEKKHLDILSPLLEKNENNISASIREIIDFADLMIKSYGSIENAIDDAVSIERIEKQRLLVDQAIWQWILECSRGLLPEKRIVESIIEPRFFSDIEGLAIQFNDLCIRLGWKTKINFKEPITYILSGGSENQRELIAKLICSCLIDQNIGINRLSHGYSITKLEMVERNSKNEAYNDCLTRLGYLDTSINEIKSQPELWNSLIKTHIHTDYQMVTIHRKNYEDLTSGIEPDDTDIFSIFSGMPCIDINLQQLLPVIKSVFETSGIVDRVEIDQDTLKIFHSYTIDKAIKATTRTVLNILEQNGYHYEAIQTPRIITLKHKTEIDGRITELIDNLISSKGNFNHELMTFLIFLDGIKDKSLINTKANELGFRMGEQILREYENEFNIKEWDLGKFKEAFSDIDQKVGRESSLELIDASVMHYIVNKCQIAHRQGKFKIHLCNLTNGLLKGAVDYAFKGDAVIKVEKMIQTGDDLCEFYVVIETKLKMPMDESYKL
ncbi:MAG: hypothetical protein E4G94_02310 [ANME-2 cluster archaeon]|nr:MAG: hypothetical protein E4G94_02310 [ANME-2 cluster archaeon]